MPAQNPFGGVSFCVLEILEPGCRDGFGLFLSQAIAHKVVARTSAKDLFRAYLHWCETERGICPIKIGVVND